MRTRDLRRRTSPPEYNLRRLSGKLVNKKDTAAESKAAKPDGHSDVDEGGQGLYDENDPLESCQDGPRQRPYREWHRYFDGVWKVEKGWGALFPRAYAPKPDQKNPWSCPLEGCHKSFASIVALGGHFNAAHIALLLHDDGHGTMKVVGKRTVPNAQGRRPPMVVSAAPLSGEHQPATSPKQGSVADRPTRASKGDTTLPPASTDSLRDGVSMRSPLWQYLQRFLPKGTGIPWSTQAHELLKAPRVRDLPATIRERLANGNIDIRKHDKFYYAILVYLTGTRGLCNNCREGKSTERLFTSCVSLSKSTSQGLRRRFPPSVCCNCYVSGPLPPCVMVHSSKLAGEKPQHSPDVGGAGKGESQRASGQPQHTALPSTANQAADEESPSTTDELAMEERTGGLPGRGHKPRRSDLIRPSHNKSDSSAPVAVSAYPERAVRMGPGLASLTSEPVPQPAACLELEDWEVAPGRIRDETAAKPENVAFSTAFLSQNQNVSIASGISFRVEMVKPGTSSRLGAEADRLRVCSVASGKVRVRLGGQEFVIGQNGVWTLKAGANCTVVNRYYLDAVLHISSVVVEDDGTMHS